MTSTAAIIRNTLVAGLLAAAVGLLAPPASAQTSTQQAARPQPPPSPKALPPPGAAPAAADPQAPSPRTTAPQTTGAKSPGTQAPGPRQTSPGRPVAKKPVPPRTAKLWKGRGFMVATGGVQAAAPSHTSALTFKLHAEDATLDARSKVRVGPVFGVRGGLRIWKNLAVGAGLGVTSTSQRASVTGRLPHPFLFNQFRDVNGTASGLERLETLVAVEASWFVALRPRVDMFLFAGPAYVNVRQDMATRIRFTEIYPYDTATFTGIESTRVSGGALGVTAGADVAYLWTKRVGVGGQLRYSFASPTLNPGGQSTAVGAGGLQLSIGGRILF